MIFTWLYNSDTILMCLFFCRGGIYKHHKLLIHYLFLLLYTLLAPIIRGDRCPIQLTLVIWICQVFHDK